MKFVSCAVWVLAALLVVTSLDSIPDPPAVNPCNVGVTSLVLAVFRLLGDVCRGRYLYP